MKAKKKMKTKSRQLIFDIIILSITLILLGYSAYMVCVVWPKRAIQIEQKQKGKS